MTFGEKLGKLTEGRNRAELSRKAGLPPNAISDYINKAYLPRVDTARAIANVTGVSLDYLADDEQDWPPPATSKADASTASDAELMLEVCRRFRRAAVNLHSALEAAERFDWISVALSFLSTPSGAEISEGLLPSLEAAGMLEMMEFEIDSFDPSSVATGLHNQLPGRALDAEELTAERLLERLKEVRNRPGFAHTWHFFNLSRIAQIDPDHRETIEKARVEMLHQLNAMGGAQLKGSGAPNTGKGSVAKGKRTPRAKP